MMSLEELDELIEKEADPQKLAELKKRRDQWLRALANESTEDPKEDELWRQHSQDPS